MPHPTAERPASVADLMAELARVTDAIRRARKPASSETDEITTQELLALYRQECAVVRRLRRRHQQWRTHTRISDGTPYKADVIKEPA